MAISKQQHKPSKLWLLFGIVIFLLVLILQLPAAWVLARFAPNQPYIEHINGSVWQGQAAWRLPSQPVAGTLAWQWRPWTLLWGKVSAKVTVLTGNSQLSGVVGMGKSGWQVQQMQGKLDTATLAPVLPWQLPQAPINIENLTLAYQQELGFTDVAGNLKWAGGLLGYPYQGKIQRIDLPPMQADLTKEQDRAHLALVNNNTERLGDIYLDKDNMLDVQLTQRLLQHMPGYQGSAALDTAVVSVRQPLQSLSGGL